eukprot:14985-Pelagomonas_calceolata.AAC.1
MVPDLLAKQWKTACASAGAPRPSGTTWSSRPTTFSNSTELEYHQGQMDGIYHEELARRRVGLELAGQGVPDSRVVGPMVEANLL